MSPDPDVLKLNPDEVRAGAKQFMSVSEAISALKAQLSSGADIAQALPGSGIIDASRNVDQTLGQVLDAHSAWPLRVAKELLDATSKITGKDEASAAGLHLDTSGDPPAPGGKPGDKQPGGEQPPEEQPHDPAPDPSAPDGPVSVTGPNGQKTQLTPDQVKNAKIIVEEGKKLGISNKGIQIALMTALDESNLNNYGSVKFPQTNQYADKKPDGAPILGNDHNSVGVFQQQVGIWGDESQIPNMMDPRIAADRYFKGYVHPDGTSNPGLSSLNYESMPTWVAAQAVQHSRFLDGSNYKAWQQGADELAKQLGAQ